MLYRRILRSAATYPSSNRDSIYQAIREEFREKASLTDPKKVAQSVHLAYKGLSQLQQFDEMQMTGGQVGSPNWNVSLEQNPMPKPADYDERKKKRQNEQLENKSDER